MEALRNNDTPVDRWHAPGLDGASRSDIPFATCLSPVLRSRLAVLLRSSGYCTIRQIPVKGTLNFASFYVPV